MEGRVHKSLLNARVNLIFYFLSLFFSFFPERSFWIAWVQTLSVCPGLWGIF